MRQTTPTPPRSRSAPPATRPTETCVHRSADCPYANSDLSVPSTLSNTRNRPHQYSGRRNSPSSQLHIRNTSIADANQRKRIGTNVHNDRPTKRGRKLEGLLPDNRCANAASGSRASARPGGNGSQIDVNASQPMQFSNLSGGTGGPGGSGGLIGGPGGNGAGTVFSMNLVFNFPR
ncbi:hypothetical protein MSAN_01831900 [Mycena sanguinolenta]|uniref:Uncharacterized protein n=1 Tax=Mycena sanguinolenta TaxID=230812 RepID=A0A8H7CQ45_9AGAR|nr:hypothetical protein MSAN_01831900 [Mycena sanguinolenta]